MRTLKFIVDGLIIKQDPNCDFSNIVHGTEGFLQAEFSFSNEWDGLVKVAEFYSALGKEYPARLLYDGKSCIIPVEALQKCVFKVRILGQGKIKLCTNKVEVHQNGGKV